MNCDSRNYIKRFPASLLVVMALAGLACGTAATATPSAKSIPAPVAAPAPGAPVAPVPTATPKPAPVLRVGETTLRVGTPFLWQPPDPVKGGLHPLQAGLAETLFKLSSKDLKPEPWLATGARQVDEKTWEITLRQGVKFHNGTLMDAAAVKASLERAVAKSPRAKALLDIARIEVKDPSTLTILTNGPSPFLPSSLTEQTTAVVDAAAAEAMGDAFTERAVLTGPFKVERFQSDKELVAVRHREYWGSSPLVDRVIFIRLVDANSRLLALQSGDIDVAVDIAPEGVATVKSDPNLTVRPARISTLIFMFLNHRREVGKDLRVRQALALAVDREALVKAVMQGQATAAAGLLPPSVLRCDQLQGHPFDPGKARQLLTQAGYQDKDGDGYVEKEGQTLTMTLLTYRQRPALPPMAEAIQAMLKAIGVKVNVRIVEDPTSAVQQQGDWDGAMWFGATSYIGEPYPFLSQWLATGGAANYGGYSSPRVDGLVSQVGQATDREAREQLACAASQAIVDEVAVVPLLFPNFNYGVSRKVVGLDDPHRHTGYLIDSKIGKR